MVKWTEESIEREIKNVMLKLEIDRMPTSQELRDNNMTGLGRAINLNGKMKYWRDKLDLHSKEKQYKWNDKSIKETLFQVMDIFCIKRMPTAEELKQLGRNDLHSAICKTKKYSGWAKELNLELKESQTVFGQKYEETIANKLIKSGYNAILTSTRFPYDLLVENTVKIDVKSGKAHRLFGSRAFTFGINKTIQTSDLYILVGLNETEQIEKTFIIPSHFIQMVTVNIGENSKYNQFIDRWDYIKQYVDFYKNII